MRLVVPETRTVRGTWVPLDSLIAGVRGSWDVYVLIKSQHAEDSDLQSVNASDNFVTDTFAPETFSVERRKVNVEYVGEGRAFVSHGLNDDDYLVDKGVQKIATGQTVTLISHASLASAR